MKTETVDGLHVGYQRRWYRHKCFTWLWYIEADTDQWLAYEGDPWPSNRIPRKELLRAVSEIKAKLNDKATLNPSPITAA